MNLLSGLLLVVAVLLPTASCFGCGEHDPEKMYSDRKHINEEFVSRIAAERNPDGTPLYKVIELDGLKNAYVVIPADSKTDTSEISACNFNLLIDMQLTVGKMWDRMMDEYQRRADLIPDLVKAVKGYSACESKMLETACGNAASIDIDAENLNEETFANFEQVQDELSQALNSLLGATEAYPDLRSNEDFLNLLSKLEGTENRIWVARGYYTKAVKEYNSAISKFPPMIYIGWVGLSPKPHFKVRPDAGKAPEVEF